MLINKLNRSSILYYHTTHLHISKDITGLNVMPIRSKVIVQTTRAVDGSGNFNVYIRVKYLKLDTILY
jgi:hypothetical protein